jgi:hypothetical protein
MSRALWHGNITIAKLLPVSPRPGAIGHGLFGDRKHRSDAVLIADIEEHAFGDDPLQPAWLKIDDKQSLLADYLVRIGTFLLDPGYDGALMIAEIDVKLHQMIRTWNVLD